MMRSNWAGLLIRNILLVVALLPATGVLRAQDAKVQELTTADAAEAKAAYVELQAAQKRWDAAQAKVRQTYKGFDNGVEFSSDFRFVVPKQADGQPCVRYHSGGCCYNLPTIFSSTALSCSTSCFTAAPRRQGPASGTWTH